VQNNKNQKKEETIMATKKAISIVFGILIIAGWILSSVSEGITETRKLKYVDRVTKMEFLSIPDVEGHSVGMAVFEGVGIFEDGELGWRKGVVIFDSPKFGVGAYDLVYYNNLSRWINNNKLYKTYK
jgi:hypothetical protein